MNADEKKQKLETCLTLYKQQMEHYHKTQDVEWKGTFGAWTLTAAAVATTFQHKLAGGSWTLSILAVPVLHAVWLLQIHRSEEFDKHLWAEYRDEACGLVSLGRHGDRGRGKVRELLWLLPEVGITLAFGVVFLWRLETPHVRLAAAACTAMILAVASTWREKTTRQRNESDAGAQAQKHMNEP